MPIDVEIMELRKCTHEKMKATNTPRRLWDYWFVHKANIRKFLPQDNLQGRTAMENDTGKTLKISEYWDLDFMTWSGTIQKSTPTLMMKIGLWVYG